MVWSKVIKLQLLGQIQPTVYFCKYFSWKMTMPIHFCTVCGCFPARMAKLWQKPYGPQSLKYFLYLILYRKHLWNPGQENWVGFWSSVKSHKVTVVSLKRDWSTWVWLCTYMEVGVGKENPLQTTSAVQVRVYKRKTAGISQVGCSARQI